MFRDYVALFPPPFQQSVQLASPPHAADQVIEKLFFYGMQLIKSPEFFPSNRLSQSNVVIVNIPLKKVFVVLKQKNHVPEN
jgi:hypothetical protein